MGYKDHAERTSAPADAREEKASHLWEMYLAEGRAPSAELLTPFARMKTWLTRIYRGVLGIRAQYRKTYGKDIELSDDVRALFGRLLAGDDAVADAAREARAEMPPAPLSAEEMRESYQLQDEARAAAEAALQRQLVQEERATDREFMREARAQVERDVGSRLEAEDPVFRVQSALERGQDGKLDLASVRDDLGPEVLKQLPKEYTAKEGGLPPDALAELYGFPSGAELVRQLVNAPARADRLREATTTRMSELYPRLTDRPALLRDAARDALGNDALLRDGLLRLRALEREAGLPPTRSDLGAIKAAARDAVAEKTIAELHPSRFEAAARSHARRAAELQDAAKRADAAEAYLFNQAMAQAARDARARAEKTARFLQRFTTDRQRAKLGLAAEEGADGRLARPYLDRVDELLGAFEFSPSSTLKDTRSREVQRAALEAWAKERWADGDSVIIPPKVLDKLGRGTHWKDLTPAELEDLRSAVESIAQQADLRRKFRVGGEKVDRERVIQELQAAAEANGAGVQQRLGVGPTLGERAAEVGRKLKHMVEHPELLFDELDGMKAGGPWKKYLWGQLSDASYQFHDLVRATTMRVQERLQQLPTAERARLRSTRFTVDGNEYTLENAIAAALNSGNESNLTKMLRGMSDPRSTQGRKGVIPWSGRGTLDKILAHLTARDVALVNEIHQMLESLRPAMEQLEKADTGLAPTWVQAKPFRFLGADGKELTIDGGYYPMIYDRRFRVGKTQAEAETLAANGMPGLFQPGYDRAMTPQGHLEARVESFARPVDLTLDALPSKLTASAKDIAFRITAKQIYRVLMDERIVGALQQALGEKGHELVLGHLRDAVNDVMLPDNGAGFALRLISKAKTQTYRSIFSLNVGQTFQNLADWAGVQAVVPQRYALGAALKIARDIPGARDRILKLSPEMRLRADGLHKTLARDLESTFRRWELSLAWDKLGDVMMKPWETTQAMVEFPVWQGAFDHAQEKLGLSEADAVRHADAAIRQLLGGRRTVDLAPIQRHAVTRNLTMFWGWAGAQLNLFLRARGRAGAAWSDGAKLRALGILGGAFARVAAVTLASELLTGNGPKDSDDDGLDAGDVGRWAAFRGATAIPGYLPIVGGGVRSLAGEAPRDVSTTPWTNMLNASVRALFATTKAISADELDEDQEVNLFLAWLEAGGSVTGAPVTQTRATARYWLNRPEDANAATDVLGSMFGRDRPGKLSHLTVEE